MKITHKMLAAPATVIAFLLAFAAVAFYSMRSEKQALDEIFNGHMRSFQQVGEQRQGLADNHSAVYRLFTWIKTYDEKTVKARTEEILKRIDAVAGWLDAQAGAAADAETKQTIERARGVLKDYRKQTADSIDMAGDDVNIAMASMQSADENFQKLAKDLGALAAAQSRLSLASYEGATVDFKRGLAIDGMLLALALGCSVAVSVVIARRISAPVMAAAKAADRIAHGDLTGTVPEGGSDETGQLLNALSVMQQNLVGVARRIGGSADQVGTSAGEVSLASDQVAQSSHGQCEQAAAMAAAVEELTVSINEVSHNAEAVREICHKSAEASQSGAQVIQNTCDEMQKMAQAVAQGAQTVQTLGEQSNKISSIVRVIKEIADQTNLLALNAAIEAARAGEQGRGFAVVADEVRKLAERTTLSTEEIAGMVGDIQGGAENAVASMNHVVAGVQQSVTLATRAGESIAAIKDGTGAITRQVTQISEALREQGTASTDIAQKVERIAQMSEENSTASRHTAEAAKRMDALSGEMRALVAHFKLNSAS